LRNIRKFDLAARALVLPGLAHDTLFVTLDNGLGTGGATLLAFVDGIHHPQ
jgi:hypothetical protein